MMGKFNIDIIDASFQQILICITLNNLVFSSRVSLCSLIEILQLTFFFIFSKIAAM